MQATALGSRVSATDGMYPGGCCRGSLGLTPPILGVVATTSHLAALGPAHVVRRTQPHTRWGAVCPLSQDPEEGVHPSWSVMGPLPAAPSRPKSRSCLGTRMQRCPQPLCWPSWCCLVLRLGDPVFSGPWPITFTICPHPLGPPGTGGCSPTGWGTAHVLRDLGDNAA